METAVAANDNRLNENVEMLREAITNLEDYPGDLDAADFAEVEKLYRILQNMVEP